MSDSTENHSDPLTEGDDELRTLISGILGGGRDEATCLRDIAAISRAKPQTARALLIHIDRYRRLGQMPATQHQAIRTCIERALGPAAAGSEMAAAPHPRYDDLTCDLSTQPQVALRASAVPRRMDTRREPSLALGPTPARRASAPEPTVAVELPLEHMAPAPGRAPASPIATSRSAAALPARRALEDQTCDLAAEPLVALRAGSHGLKVETGLAANPIGRPAANPMLAPNAPLLGVPTVSAAPPAPSVAPATVPQPGIAPAPELGVGRVLRDRYELQRLIGRGGMASVYQAVDRYRVSLGLEECLVAVKVVPTEASRPASRAALGREFHNAQRLSHPNVINVYEIDRDADAAFYTMELLTGARLGQVVEKLDGAVLARPYALAIIRDIGAAITHAHARGVVHGDLKPSNVMITQDGQVRVLDFGGHFLSLREPWFAEPDASDAFRPATPAYASCEQLERHRADPRDDIYALACIAYLLLTGRHPFDHLSAIEARARALHVRRPEGSSARQWRALRRGFAWNREQRTMAVDGWLARLGLDGAVATLPPLAELGTTVPAAHPWRLVAALGLPVLVAIAATVAWHAPIRGPSGLLGRVRGSAEETLGSAWQELQTLGPAAAGASATPLEAQQTTARQPAAAAAAARAPAAGARAVVALRSDDGATAPHVAFAAESYAVGEGEPAARIVVRRVGSNRGDVSFVWWTEAASAEPDVDYASLGRRTEHLPSGQDKMTVYVPIISNPLRRQATEFHVALAESSNGRVAASAAAQSARATVTIQRGG